MRRIAPACLPDGIAMGASRVLSACLLLPAGLMAVDGSDIAADAGRGRGSSEAPPDFVLEYDLQRAFSKNAVWEDGPRVTVGIGAFDQDGIEQFGAVLDDDTGDLIFVNIDWQAPARRPMSKIGFYASIGLSLVQYSWEGLQGDDLGVLTISPRITAGYGFLITPALMWEIGVHFEYGVSWTDDFTFFGQSYSGDTDWVFVGGLDTSLLYSFGHGLGPELGLNVQVDHRRMRMPFSNDVNGAEFTDTAIGMAWTVGAVFGWRF